MPGVTPPSEHVIRIGGFSNELAARSDLKDFKDAGVFQNRSSMFPNPNAYGLKVKIVSTDVKPFAKPPTPLNTHYQEIKVSVSGAQAKISSWIMTVDKMVASTVPTPLKRGG